MRSAQVCGIALVLLAGCMAVEPPAVLPPAFVLPTPPPESEPWILIRKTAHTLSLYEGHQLVKVYPVVFGKDPLWAKLHQGDHRTPEGEYHVSEKYFHPYWSRFLLLDYPTSRNQEMYVWSRAHGLLPVRNGKVPTIGGAIGIHGTEDEGLNRRGVNWTEGCISLLNRDVDELYDKLPIGTRVVIER